MFDGTYIDSVYNSFTNNYKQLLSLIKTEDEYNFYKPWLDFVYYSNLYLTNVYKNSNQYIKQPQEEILARKLNKLVLIVSYMYKNYYNFYNFENINKFREFIIDTIEINYYDRDIVSYYSNKLITINKLPETFIPRYYKLISLLHLIFSFVYLNYDADENVKKFIEYKHNEFVKSLTNIDFRSSLSRRSKNFNI